MNALLDRDDYSCLLVMELCADGDARFYAKGGHDDGHGPAMSVQIDVSLNDAEVWLTAMLDRVRAAKAVVP